MRLAKLRLQRGMSLVELMVGLAVGLFVVSGAILVVSSQLGDNRRLLLETQLQQDLRAAADIITRELRRAGSEGQFESLVQSGIWFPGTTNVTHSLVSEVPLTSGPSSDVEFSYRRIGSGPYGFSLDDGVIKSLLGGRPQDLTDGNVMEVTSFDVAALEPQTFQIPCPRACSVDPTDTACWPTLTVRNYVVEIQARSRSDQTVLRSIRSQVRLRNDWVQFDPANAGQACPG